MEDVESFVEGITQNHHPTTTTTTRKKARFESALDEAIERKGLTFFTGRTIFYARDAVPIARGVP